MTVKLVVGLGNPGSKYKNTRHNIGFRILDTLAGELGVDFTGNKKLLAEIGRNSDVILLKPQTFMNDSGEAVGAAMNFYNIDIGNLLIVNDEIDLPLGKIKMASGGSAGHHGVDSILNSIGTGFMRLRIGIENRAEYRIPETDAYVLQNFTTEEEQKLSESIIPKAADEIKKFLKIEN